MTFAVLLKYLYLDQELGHGTVDRHIPTRQRWLRARGQRRADPTVGHAWLSLSADTLHGELLNEAMRQSNMPLRINLNLDNILEVYWRVVLEFPNLV